MKVLLAFFILLFSYQSSSAQIERYTLYNGKRYLIHVVEKGNTMYSISRKYDVDVKTILDANPYAKEGIKFGQELRIPLFEAKTEGVNDREEAGFILHTVRRKETLFSLSQAYNVDIADIERYNPYVRKGIQVGDEVRIPKQSELKKTLNVPADTKNYFLHRVLQDQTLYSLSKLYTVSVEDIKAINGGLPEGLKLGAEIKIPRNGNISSPNGDEKKNSESYIEGGLNQNINYEPKEGRSQAYNIALFLPFDVERLDTTAVYGDNQIALEYYFGFKMAIDSLNSFGANIALKVYDTERNPNKVRSLLYRPEMANVDFLVGPMYKSCLEVALPFALSRNLNVLCPVPQDDELSAQFPNLILAHTSKENQFKKLCSLIRVKSDNSRLISIAPATDLNRKYINIFHNQTESKNLFGQVLTDTVWHYAVNEQVEMKELEYYLSETQPNIVFVSSEEVGFVSEVLTALNGMRKYDIKVVGFESWDKFTKIETEYKNNTSLTIPSNYYIDYNAPITKKFFQKYVGKYGKEPNKYAVMGYDQAFFFAKGMYTYGFDFFNSYQKVFFDPVASKYLFERDEFGSGFQNKSSFVLTYKDFELKPFSW